MLRTVYLFIPIFREICFSKNISSSYWVGYDFVEKCNNTSIVSVFLKDIHKRNMVWLNTMLEDSNKSVRAKDIQHKLDVAQGSKERIKALVEIELLWNE